MNENLVRWWGFRLRLPLDYDPAPINRREALTFSFLVATALEVLWLGYLTLFHPDLDRHLVRFMKDDTFYPLLLTVLPVLLAVLLPPSALNLLRVGPWLILAREKGQLKSWDLLIVLLAVVVMVLGLFRLGSPHWIVCLLILFDAALASLGLAFLQDRVDFSRRRWHIPVPDWFEDPGDDEIQDKDADSDPVYQFDVDPEASYSVGIRIPSEVLAKLRAINAEHEGRLYQEAPVAVVMVDRPPAENVGRQELIRFCNQILSIVRKHAPTPYAACNMVLFFVQKVIRYELDEDSTAAFPGGPYVEYGRFALETIHDQVGDCECTALFCASLLTHLGFNAALLHVRVPDSNSDDLIPHLAIGVEVGDIMQSEDIAVSSFDTIAATDGSGRRYLYGETAVDGGTLAFGGVPPEWKSRMQVHGVDPIEP